jgi:hypothetical protein
MFGWAVPPRHYRGGPRRHAGRTVALGAIRFQVKNPPKKGKGMLSVVRSYLDTWVGPLPSLPERLAAFAHDEIATPILSH